MAGSKEAAEKAKQTQIAKFGSEELYKADMARRNAERKTKGSSYYFKDPEKAREASKRGHATKRLKREMNAEVS